MGKVRPLSRSKYGISGNRFRELYYWCLQYGEWREELEGRAAPSGSMYVGEGLEEGGGEKGQAGEHVPSSRRAWLEQNCRLLEQTAADADPDISPYILRAVTDGDVTYQYLKMSMGMPCGKDMYYDRRRRFYWLLDQRKAL